MRSGEVGDRWPVVVLTFVPPTLREKRAKSGAPFVVIAESKTFGLLC